VTLYTYIYIYIYLFIYLFPFKIKRRNWLTLTTKPAHTDGLLQLSGFLTSFLCVGARSEESDAPLIESGRLIRNTVTSLLHSLLHRLPRKKKNSVNVNDGCQGKLGTKVWQRKMFLETFGEPDAIRRLDGNQTCRIQIGGSTVLNTKISTRQVMHQNV